MKAEAEPKFLTVAKAAAELEVSPATVRKWSNEGHFAIFQPPGPRAAGTPGPRLLRISRQEWRRFLDSHTRVAEAKSDAAPSPPRPRTRAEDARGPDGVDRRRGR